MPKKSSIRDPMSAFSNEARRLIALASLPAGRGMTREDVGDYCAIGLWRAFEAALAEALAASLNHDTSALSEKSGVRFPRHLGADVCRYLVAGDGHLNFRGNNYDGIMGVLRRFLSEKSALLSIFSKADAEVRAAINLAGALRNEAAHRSADSRRRARRTAAEYFRAKKLPPPQRMAAAGKWVTAQGRFEEIAQTLLSVMDDVGKDAPF